MDINKLRELLKKNEGPKLDFKLKLSLSTDGEKKELCKDVIAIANSRGGRGYIIFGVEDKTKRIVGVKSSDYNEEKIQQSIYNRVDPPVPISVDLFQLEGKTLAVLTIFRSHHKPHQMLQNGSFYVRRGSTTDVGRREEIAKLFQESGLLSYETVIMKNVRTEALNMDLIRKYFSMLGVTGETTNDILLEAMGIIGKSSIGPFYHPTIGGMLLFGNSPSAYLPHSYVKVIHMDEAIFFHGNIIKMLDDVSGYLERAITEEGYPIEAIKEAIANALVHRDYLDISRGIVVVITDKSIEISNPGSNISYNTVNKFMYDNNIERRNPWLYQRLLILDDKKRFLKTGTGLKKIKKYFSGRGGVKFLNLGRYNLFKVIFPRGTKMQEGSTDKKNKNKSKKKNKAV